MGACRNCELDARPGADLCDVCRLTRVSLCLVCRTVRPREPGDVLDVADEEWAFLCGGCRRIVRQVADCPDLYDAAVHLVASGDPTLSALLER